MITYSTIREAAIAATLQAISLSKRDGWEYGGTIYRSNERFYFDGPNTSKQTHTVTTTVDRRKNPVGMYHTHVADDWHGKENATEYFSQPDLLNAISTNSFAYLGHVTSGKIFEVDARSKYDFDSANYRIVNAFSEDGPVTVVKGAEIYNPQGALHAA